MKVSIITVCFNSENTISDTIKSILYQTYDDIEYIIVDGMSTDKTFLIIKEYEALFNGRMKVISEPDKGLYDAMNKGIKLAAGEIIGILNSDDFYSDNEVIQNIVEQINHDRSDLIYADLEYIDKNEPSKVVRKWHAGTGRISFGWNPPHPTTFLTKSVYDKVGLYNPDYRISSDFDFLNKALRHNDIKISYLKKTIVKMRMGGASTSGLKSLIVGNKEIYHALKAYNIRFPAIIILLRLFRKIYQFI